MLNTKKLTFLKTKKKKESKKKTQIYRAFTSLKNQSKVRILSFLEGLEAQPSSQEEEQSNANTPGQGGCATFLDESINATSNKDQAIGDREAEIVHIVGK